MAERNLAREVATERRVAALFRAMSTDFLLREQFVTGPAEVLSDYLGGEPLPEGTDDAANLLIYSIAASPPLMLWLRRYALTHARRRPPLHVFARDFSRAVVETRAHHVVQTIVGHAPAAAAVMSPAVLQGFMNGVLYVFGPGPDRSSGALTAGPETASGTTTAAGTFQTGTQSGGTSPGTFPPSTFQTQGTWTGITASTWVTADTGTIFTAGGTVTGTLTVTDLGTWSTGTETGTDQTDSTGTDQTGTDQTGTDGTGTDSTGTETTGTEQTGTDSTGTDSTGTDSTGTDSTGTEDTGTDTTGTDSGINFGDTNWAAITLIDLAQYAAQLVLAGGLAAGG